MDSLFDCCKVGKGGSSRTIGWPNLWQLWLWDRVSSISSIAVVSITAANRGVDWVGAADGATYAMSIIVELDIVEVSVEVDCSPVLESCRAVQYVEVAIVTEGEEVLNRHARTLVA
jgi:hypothetical protein